MAVTPDQILSALQQDPLSLVDLADALPALVDDVDPVLSHLAQQGLVERVDGEEQRWRVSSQIQRGGFKDGYIERSVEGASSKSGSD